MLDSILTLLVLGLLAANSLALLLSRAWRWTLVVLGAQYLLAFFLVSASWPLELAAVKLVAGWIVTAILGLTLLNLPEIPQESQAHFPRSPAFFILVAGVVAVMVVGMAPELVSWSRQFNIAQAWGGLFLIGIGVALVGLSDSNFRNILGLLMLLSGFEIVYAAVETSILVAGLLAILNLGVALIGSYLMQSANSEPA
ncbi:MAG: hypothetical protein WD740_05910 [Anaerolineales bacterium]